MPGVRKPIIERFWDKVNMNGPDDCWLWTASTTIAGYGQLHGGVRSGVNVLAHRFSYEIHVGPIPSATCVCHKCDVPCCVNPQHFFLGSKGDNIRDAKSKRRHQHGERHAMAKLTDEIVTKIRFASERGVTQDALAAKYGVTPNAIWLVLNNKTWRHV